MTEIPTTENAHETATKLRAALRELADNPERSPEQVKERLNELVQALDGLCDELKPQEEQ